MTSAAQIHLATAKGPRTVGSAAAADPLGGFDTTTVVRGEDGVLFALTRHRRIWRIANGEAEPLARVDGALAWCLLWHADALWVGTDEAGLLRLTGDRLERVAGFDAAPERERWEQPVKRPATTWTLASDGPRLYVNVHVGGILRSSDDGKSFIPTIDLEVDVHEVNVGRDDALWAATGEQGLAESRDHGATWRHHAAGLHARYLSCAVPSEDGVLVVASSGYAAPDDTVYRLDGCCFVRGQGLPDGFGGFLGARQLAARGRVAAVADAEGRLHASNDAGRTWHVAATGLPSVRAIVIA